MIQILPVFYSYRRCPYAMRARLALAFAGIDFELREISFKNKPENMLKHSPKGTVPVLILPNGDVIDESLDIVIWAAKNALKENFAPLTMKQDDLGKKLYTELHENFIPNLHRYKYPDRFAEEASKMSLDQKAYGEYHRAACIVVLKKITAILLPQKFLMGDKISIYDVLFFPLVRQFRVVNTGWFDDSIKYPGLKKWMTFFMRHPLFAKVMEKHPLWIEKTADHN